MPTTSQPPPPIAWPDDLYKLVSISDSGRSTEVLALCTQHHGEHVRHGRPGDDMWCAQLPAHRPVSRQARALARLREPPREPAGRVVIDEEQLGQTIADAIVAGLRRARREEREGQ